MTDVPLTWGELHWQRPLDPGRCIELLRRLAARSSRDSLVLEACGHDGHVTYLLGMAEEHVSTVSQQFHTLLPECRVGVDGVARPAVGSARQVAPSTRHRRLTVDVPDTVARTILAAMTRARKGESLVIQLVLGRGVRPSIPPSKTTSSTQPVWSVLWHGALPGSTEETKAAQIKHAVHGFDCLIRVGVTAASSTRRRSLVGELLAALRTTEPGGLKLRDQATSPVAFERGTRPLWSWSTTLTIHEVLALSAWPVGDSELPGIAPLHPRRLPPSSATHPDRIVALSTAPGVTTPLAQSISDVLRHRHILGPSGVGKSLLLGRLIHADIAAGQSVIVIEPKGDLVDDVLAHLPANRRDDVVILDPVDPRPVGINPLAPVAGVSPEIAAEGVLAIFKDLYADSWGPRTQDILHAGLLTLTRWAARHQSHSNQTAETGASLLLLPMLLTNARFRTQVIREVRDPVALDTFWQWYEGTSDAERAAAIAPVMNKLRAWLYHPGLRTVLGQTQPRCAVRDIFAASADRAPILLVPLRTGLVGREASRLLGSLVLAQVWQAIQARTGVPEGQRRPVSVYIDECQNYITGTTDIGEALATARGLGCSFTLAHQFLHQLPRELRTGVLANARSRICFQLAPDDAVAMAKGHPEIRPEDFTSLDRYELQASLVVNHRATPYAAGRCAPPGPTTSSPDQMHRRSRDRYGADPAAVEVDLATCASMPSTRSATATGRRPRRTSDSNADTDRTQREGGGAA